MKRVVRLVAMTVLLGLAGAGPAQAHGGPGGDSVGATNFVTTVKDRTQLPRGLTFKTIEFGSRMQLTNRTGKEALVLGYEGEPYLRVGPRGVFANMRSPAVYLNATRDGEIPPKTADPAAPPDWEEIDGPATVARWHDHRAHWMGEDDPPVVRRDPDRRHVIIPEWKVPIRVGDKVAEVRGDLVWIPGPRPRGWLALAGVFAFSVAALARTRLWRWALAAALAGLLAASFVDVVGSWWYSPRGAAEKGMGLFYSVIFWSACVGGIVFALRRRGLDETTAARRDIDSLTVGGFGALVTGLVYGVTNLGYLSKSQLPSAISPTLARVGASVALGLAAGVVLMVLLRIPTMRLLPKAAAS